MAAPQGVLDELRVRLGSPSTGELPDAQLSSSLEAALRLLSRFRPREASATLSLLRGVSLYDLPDGVRSVRRLYYTPSAAPPLTHEGPLSGLDSGLAGALAGLSPALDWPLALDARQNASRDRSLYGGDWYVEAGQLAVAPAPSEDVDVLLVYPAPWAWADVATSDGYGALLSVDAPEAFEDLLLYGIWKGWERLAHARRRLRAVSRLGQSTAFASGDEEAASARDAAALWASRVERVRAGPLKG